MQMSIHNPKPPTLCRLLVHHYKVRLHRPFSAAFSDHANKIGEFIRENVEANFKKRTKHGDVKSMQLKNLSPKSLHRGHKEFRTHDK